MTAREALASALAKETGVADSADTELLRCADIIIMRLYVDGYDITPHGDEPKGK